MNRETRNPRTGRTSLLAALALLAASAGLSNTVLFRQAVQGNTDLTRRLPAHLGGWLQVAETPVSASEIRGLETRDVVKRVYSDGRDHVEMVVAYIAHSSRKSAHAQEACLRGSGAMVSKVESRRLERTPVQAKSIVLDQASGRHHVYYWYKIGNVYTADFLSSSLKMFFSGIFGSKNQGAALIRLLTPVRHGESQVQVDKRLEEFTVHLIPELEKTLP